MQKAHIIKIWRIVDARRTLRCAGDNCRRSAAPCIGDGTLCVECRRLRHAQQRSVIAPLHCASKRMKGKAPLPSPVVAAPNARRHA